eukprot:TRINITY_DN58684_c0_g1_i1.p1 TRINITY_DN58684_c0_g1~~TRINITY_DN58684_c0_g1_i1.p1  ORF type:complete len:128 (+),score=8.42 TRINITY_DN58684_c0_g1_i1:130-513(+)
MVDIAVQVFGAAGKHGEHAVNGTYRYKDRVNGAPRYEKVGSPACYIHATSAYWVIRTDEQDESRAFFINFCDVGDVLPQANWENNYPERQCTLPTVDVPGTRTEAQPETAKLRQMNKSSDSTLAKPQ